MLAVKKKTSPKELNIEVVFNQQLFSVKSWRGKFFSYQSSQQNR